MDQFKFQITDNQQVTFKNIAKIALNAKLHFSRKSCLKYDLEWYTKLKTKKSYIWTRDKVKHRRPFVLIGLCFINDNPIGICVIRGWQVQWYTHKNFRQMGVASALFTKLYTHYDLCSKLMNHDRHKAIMRLKDKFGIAHNFEELRSK